MHLEIEGANISAYVVDQQFKLVRTYVGEIERTQTGLIKQFGTSFVTLGFDLVLMAQRSIIEDVQQILLSENVVTVVTDYNTTRIKGKFSCTQNSCEEVRDKSTSLLRLSVAVVSDGSNIGDSSGSPFVVKKDGVQHTDPKCSDYFGKIHDLGAACKKQLADGSYMTLPSNKILVLGPEAVVSV